MLVRVAILVLGASICLRAEDLKLQESWTYVSDPLKWERGYRPGQPTPKLAFGEIVVLQPNGSLAILAGTLYRTREGRLTIIYGEGYSVFSGTWRKSDGKISTRYRTIYANIPPISGLSKEYKQEVWTYRSDPGGARLASWLRAPHSKYVPVKSFEGLESLAKIIQFYRSQQQPDEIKKMGTVHDSNPRVHPAGFPDKPAVGDGTFTIRLDIRDRADISDLRPVGPGEFELKQSYGIQEIPPMSRNFPFDAQNEWGSVRARLNELTGERRPEFLGQYLHGKRREGDYTHGCICERSERILRLLQQLNPRQAPKIPVWVRRP